jgi:DNA replicative helicase MCM subunit Mcm2 (Cdc46/Mcm family)
MACFYAMEELGLPFNKTVLFHADTEKLEKAKDPATIDLGKGRKLAIAPGTVTTTGELTPQALYTLRVCKDCRATWMGAIADWFKNKPEPAESCGSGIFVRRNGATVEITEDEWYRDNPGREPCRVKLP